MKGLIPVLVCLTSLVAFGQNAKVEFDGAHWNAPYTLSVPFGWGIERSPIQKEVGPEASFKGVEDIRYTPGWGNSKSSQYWSYGFLWYLNESPKINTEIIEKNLTAHYSELLEKNNVKQNTLPVKTWFTELNSQNGDVKTFSGAIAMFDYMDKKPIILNCIVHVKTSSEQNKTFVFFEVSPQPLTGQVWKSLDQLWLTFDDTASQHKPRLSMKTYFHESVVGGS